MIIRSHRNNYHARPEYLESRVSNKDSQWLCDPKTYYETIHSNAFMSMFNSFGVHIIIYDSSGHW